MTPSAVASPVRPGFPSIVSQSELEPGGPIVRVTGTIFGEPCAPGAVIVRLPLYEPTPSPFVATLTSMLCGAVPLCGVAASHGASTEVVKSSTPAPELVTLTCAWAGIGPPWSAANDSVVGETASTGCVEASPLPYADSGPSV